MGCLPLKRYEIISQTEFNLTSKTLPLNRITNEIPELELSITN